MSSSLHVYCRCVFRGVLYSDRNFVTVRLTSTTAQRWPTADKSFLSFQWWRKRFLNIQQLYDEVTGLKEVHDAQSRVIEAEKHFILAQEERRKIQSQLSTLQKKLKQIYAELDKTPRGEERYVQLVTMEHAVIKEEKMISEVFHEKEREERDNFSVLSSAVKMGHEKERAQAERTKYWSIIGSVFGTLLGMIASSIMNDLRMRELRNIVSKAVNMDAENQKDYSELLIENKNRLELLVSSVQKLNENPEVYEKLELLVSSVQKLNESPVVYEKPVGLVVENRDAEIPNYLTATLVAFAVAICIKYLM